MTKSTYLMWATSWSVRIAAWMAGSALGYLAWTAIRDALWDEPAISTAGTQLEYSIAAAMPVWVVVALVSAGSWRLASRPSGGRVLQRAAVDATVIAFVAVPLIGLTLLFANFTPN